MVDNRSYNIRYKLFGVDPDNEVGLIPLLGNKRMKDRIDRLIAEGEAYTFRQNCYHADHGIFSRPSVQMQAWIAEVEDAIRTGYGEDSAPWRAFERSSVRRLNGNHEDGFEKEKAIILSALHACLRVSLKTSEPGIPKTNALSGIFERFHLVARELRNRHDGRSTLDVEDEYDVQDLLSSLLKLYVDDVRREEWTPSYAGGSARMDFLLKQERTVIEVKRARRGLGDRELGNQLIEDRARYKVHPDCRKLICFVYDPEGRIGNPRGICNDLDAIEDDFEVKVIIKPDA